MHVPLFDTKAEYAEIKKEIDGAVGRVLSSGRFVGGPEVSAFEAEFSAHVGDRDVAAVNSGTDALRLALQGLGIQAGDEVVIPANTFSATAMAIEQVGGIPVVADIDPFSYLMSAESIEALVTDQTRAVLPVHLYGRLAPMSEINEVARQHDLVVIEDAAQAHGASLDGKPAGSWGGAAAFSFYVSKNLGAYGDGGAVVADPDVIARVKALRDLGRDETGEHVLLGVNSRLDAIQAAILRVKLPHLDTWLDSRQRRAERYRESLEEADVELPTEGTPGVHVYHLFVIRVPRRDMVREKLRQRGVEAGIHYPTPIHLQPAHVGRVKVPNGAPNAEKAAREILSLPIYPQMTDTQQDHVIAALRAALQDVQ